MPIYEYRCEQCGDFEEMQRITDPPLSRCPKCKRKVRRLISSTSFQLKGSGWYVTDYARAGGGNGKEASGGSEAKADSKAETKTESKSDTKPSSGTSEKPAS
ncbi:MAG TPA: FmdB family zinc ribbon protein [Candidatus Binatia bacterium]|nr:FmdB family zinc ribbon protein [Candidatus Binatia bacterium]